MRIKPRIKVSRRIHLRRVIKLAAVSLLWFFVAVNIGMFLYHDRYRKPMTSKGMVSFEIGPDNLLRVGGVKVHRIAQAAVEKVSSSSARIMAPYESPLLVFTCKRDKYLKETLDDILKYIPSDCSMGCPVIVSQDGNNADVETVIRQAQADFQQHANIPVVHLQHSSALRGATTNAYQALAIHYGWALTQVFDNKAVATDHAAVVPKRVIILEEDLHIAPDFFRYFGAMAPILEKDSTLYAVSAFNDNGFQGKVKDASRVLRSDFFPGLGWMMTRRLWDQELKVKWPSGYWDDWLRLEAQRQGRHVLRPEVSRTYHFGFQGGASGNQFGGQLQRIQLDSELVDWKIQNLSVLTPDEYDRYYWNTISSAKRVNSFDEAMEACKGSHVVLEYHDMDGFREIARPLELMLDEKDGILRTAYRGIVETRPYGDNLLFLTPPLIDLQKSLPHIGIAES